jgi:uncharacterized membrane protein
MNPDQTDTNRVEAFSDAVIAIVMTILVLEIKVPEHLPGGDAALWQALLALAPSILSWVVSFFFVLVFWVAHHYFFSEIRTVDRTLLWLNGLFLLFLSFTPFPTALNGHYPQSSTAAFVLSATMFLAASSFSAMRWYVSRHESLMAEGCHKRHAKAFKRGLTAPALYTAAMALSFIWVPGALIIQIIVPVIFLFPGRFTPVEYD